MIRLDESLKNYKKFAIAFSGGVDSTFLVASAKKICGDEVVAITADSPFQSREELKKACEIAATIGIQHFVVKVDVLGVSDIITNSKKRCYFCKKKLFGVLKKRAMELGFNTLAHGVNMDDLKEYRPGLKAAQEMDIISPLVDAQLTKSQIRLASKNMGLSTWNIPSQSCLATRIPYCEIITVEKLTRIEACENFLNQLGFYGIRVRCHSIIADSNISGNCIARIECPIQSISQMVNSNIRKKIISFFKANGFQFVSIDLSGYIAGSIN